MRNRHSLSRRAGETLLVSWSQIGVLEVATVAGMSLVGRKESHTTSKVHLLYRVLVELSMRWGPGGGGRLINKHITA